MAYDKELYKQRNQVERLFRRIKRFRRIFTRYDKLDLIFFTFVYFALIIDALMWTLPKTVGKYGSLRRTYLKERRHELWRELAGSGKLTAHLLDIDKTASEWMDRMLPQMMKAAGVTEELKARNQMAWIGLVNNCKAQVEEIIFSDLIYV